MLQEARPGIPNRKVYVEPRPNYGWEYHRNPEPETEPFSNDLPHIKWYDWRKRSPGPGKGHVFYDRWT